MSPQVPRKFGRAHEGHADIGKMLGISTDAVNQHLTLVCSKLGAANRSEAVAIALSRHLLKT